MTKSEIKQGAEGYYPQKDRKREVWEHMKT